MFAVECDQIGLLFRFMIANGEAERPGAAPYRIIPEIIADMGFSAGRADVPPVCDEALAVFQPSQFFNGTDGDVAVRTDAEIPAVSQKLPEPENTVSQVGFSGRTQSHDTIARSQSANLPVRQVGCVNQAPAPVDIDIFE